MAALVPILFLLNGCATPPPADDKEAMEEWEQTNDPLEPMNRAIFDFNDTVDKALFLPVAQGYQAVIPQFGRDRIRDFLNNLRAPAILTNDILQGEPDRAMQTFMRFMFNTGIGFGGLFDIASEGGIPYHDEDFGQTLAVWGVGEGVYLVVPFLGPSNLRDATGLAVEIYADPFSHWMENTGRNAVLWGRLGVSNVDKRESLLKPMAELERQSLDFYTTLRSAYRQNREAEIKNLSYQGLPSVGTSAPFSRSE